MSEPKKSKNRLKKIADMGGVPDIPSSEDPVVELRRLVREHRALTKAVTGIMNMASDKTDRKTGEKILCRLPEDVQVELREAAKRQSLKIDKIQRLMEKQLKKVPIWNVFLSKVWGCGPVVGSYLASEIDIRKAVKPSNLRRFCGLAVINGRLERRVRGQKSCYSQEMRTALWQMAFAMRKNGARWGTSNKYLEVWDNWIVRMEAASWCDDTSRLERATACYETRVSERTRGFEDTSVKECAALRDETTDKERAELPDGTKPGERVDRSDETISCERATTTDVTRASVRAGQLDATASDERAKCDDETISRERARGDDETSPRKRAPRKNDGWARAMDIFLTDLYVVWRALECLPVWPSYLAGVVRKFEHKTGAPVENVPRMMKLDEALAFVGDVGGKKLELPVAAE